MYVSERIRKDSGGFHTDLYYRGKTMEEPWRNERNTLEDGSGDSYHRALWSRYRQHSLTANMDCLTASLTTATTTGCIRKSFFFTHILRVHTHGGYIGPIL